ncbi:DNA polymerase Y family protein [Amycolatopsis sp. NPDC098790]|uniref:DNA polymerase Y family protein n=1 Tax=Amycolatopsis sp. NPDC098790 TaxID=3363939 RepID=UPI0038015D6F
MSGDAVRLLVLWCPDWPVVAAGAATGIPPLAPAAVFSANRVVTCSAAARRSGIARGMRRRDAQARCPELVVHQHDPDRDARLFEPVAAAVEAHAVGVEVVRPGIVAVPVAGAAGYFGGEEALAELLITEVEAHVGVECQVGVADGLFAATLAARRATFVPSGGAAAFLAPLSVAELDQPGDERGELVGLLQRLGLRTLGAFAALTEREVAGRFPRDAITAHRLARGLAQRPPVRRALPPDLAITETFEHPLERVDEAAFVAKTLGERFFAGLARHGFACTRLAITALTEAGEERVRVWRCAEPLTARATADRVRWQCEGWLTVRDGDRPSAGIVRLTLDPEEVVGGNALQLQLGSMGQDADAAERAARALVRIQGLLGPDAVCTPLLDGGRGPAERVRLIPWGEPRRPVLEDRPWPGRLPAPSPALVPSRAASVTVLDDAGDIVCCSERGELDRPPAMVALGDGPPRRVLAVAGPWIVRPTLPGQGRRPLVRLQVVLERDGEDLAMLLAGTVGADPQWTIEGDYD